MYIKIIGAIVIVGCCGGYGMLLAASYRREVALLRELKRVYERMYSELEYRLTPIPELCRLCGAEASAPLSRIFLELGARLEKQSSPDVCAAMKAVLEKEKSLPYTAMEQLQLLGQTFGRFDLPGQLRGLRQCAEECEHKCNELEYDQRQRLRSYQTLGFCAGAALAILLF